ncbi:MBL fold metallo-hydrolase [Aeoliella mucimassa]|uniref:ComEC family competence protein n=1 Tax=Aeoliella mucimassa TaxID=2527972 RepID=A0A518AW07_9BACT|nr:MBL fold metallo-hydrolase [Aeoliella mucimassa]QDU58927.1 ComEC family competence protein [Aeoliella mucimassa]
MTHIAITALVENTANGQHVRGEHGLAFWIEVDDQRLLFDTGQTSETLCHNAACLGIDLRTVKSVVLSHGHYDHTGGLKEVLHQATRPRLFLHPAALEPRYSRRSNGTTSAIGIRGGLTEVDWQRRAELVWTEQPTQILDGVTVTGGVPRATEFENTGGDFYLDSDCTRIDTIPDDQALFFDTAEGTVVLLGCAHAGVINTLEYIQQLTDGKPLHAVIGGMHLLNASSDRMERTIRSLTSLGVQMIAPAHCSGGRSAARLWAEFPDRWVPCPVGTRFEFRA